MATHRSFVMVAEWLYLQFWSEWREIDRRWPHFESNPVVSKLRFSARQDLRDWTKANAIASGGPYVIAV